MRKAFTILGLLSAVVTTAHAQTQAFIDRKTKSFTLVADIRKDHRIFGYSAPDSHAKKLILFSVFTTDVKNNPYHCPLGAYYQTSDLRPGEDIYYVSETPTFVKLTFLDTSHQLTPFYIKRAFVRFD